jgi:hypothetical protein
MPKRKSDLGQEERSMQMSQKLETVVARRTGIAFPRIRLAAVLALGVAAFLVGWLIIGSGDESAPSTGASIASESELRDVAASTSTPVYWVGPREGHTYEVTRTSDGRIYVRYLPEGVDAGDSRPQFLTVGTYPRPNAWAELRRASREPGAVSRRLPNDGMMVFSRNRPTSVYVGYAGGRFQIEVFHPSPNEARKLVLDGGVVPVR